MNDQPTWLRGLWTQNPETMLRYLVTRIWRAYAPAGTEVELRLFKGPVADQGYIVRTATTKYVMGINDALSLRDRWRIFWHELGHVALDDQPVIRDVAIRNNPDLAPSRARDLLGRITKLEPGFKSRYRVKETRLDDWAEQESARWVKAHF